MDKRKSKAFGKNTFLLGKDAEGILYWLEEAQWECDWYWGIGYVETYTINHHPSLSRDIRSHQHFDGLFMNKQKNIKDSMEEFFTETPFTDGELWKIAELMKSAYIARSYSDMVSLGGCGYTTNPAMNIIKSEEEYKRINEQVIPAIMSELYDILSPVSALEEQLTEIFG